MSNDLAKPEGRIIEVMRMAQKLGWIKPPNHKPPYDSYPTMQLSEVEKCMLAIMNPSDFDRMRMWCGEKREFDKQ